MFIFLAVHIYVTAMLFRLKKNYTEVNFLKSKEVNPINSLLQVHSLKLRSRSLERKIRVRLYLPTVIEKCKFTLLLNDGQDMEQLQLIEALQGLYTKGGGDIKFAVVAIHANENRMQEYGVAGSPDFKNRGKKASAYSNFIIKELTPYLQRKYGLMKETDPNVFAGFSMGGLSALDISWNNPHLFKKAGVFSGSLWWRSKNTETPMDDASRIMHRKIRESEKREDFKFWFQTGTKDETKDRNKNGVIDSIDDTRDLIADLKSIGYSNEDIIYEEILDGQHNFNTWSMIFPQFLRWAFVD
ncbi:hypothetical protein BH23BAC2_BH23BAC2_13190 [soil metagenome]